MQTVERPRFRQDLVAEPIEDGGARFIDVADPDSGHMYRFFEVEYSLACAMDGERDVAGIVRWAEEELGLKPSAKEVRSVIATLGDLGYLESGAAAAAAVNAAAASQPVAKEPAPAVELERGVVAAPAARSTAPSVDVELGASGGRAPAAASPPPSADFELGAPGARAPAAPARAKAEDIALGASGGGRAPNVSTDLAADMAVSPADVKEAVRASQVMKSVDVPPELAAELEPAKPVAAKPVAAKPVAATPVAAAPAAPARPPEPVVQAKPAEAPAQKPVEMPSERPVQPKAPTAPSARVSPVLIGLLVLVVLAAVGFLVYKYVLEKTDAEPQAKVEPVQPTAPVAPPPPPVETAKLAVEQPAPEEIKPTTAATVATIVANDTAVKAGEPIARLVGYKPLEAETAALQKTIDKAKADLEKATKDRDAAQTAGNKAGITQNENKIAAHTKTLTTAEGSLATKTAALDKLLIKAPAAGKVTAIAKANAKVTPTDIIATLTRDPVVVATFKSAGEVAPDTRVLLAIQGSEQKLQCTVVASGGDGTKIACPQGAAPEGTEVSYAGVDPNAPPPADGPAEDPAEEAIETPGTGSAEPATEEPATEEPAEAEKPAEKKAAKRPARRQPKKAPEKAAEKPAEKAAEKPADKAPAPADKPAEKPAEPTPAGSGA